MALEVCARCRRSPLGVFKPVRKINGQRYCLSCAIAIEGEPVEPAPEAPAKASQGIGVSVVASHGMQPESDMPRYFCTQCHTYSNTAKMKGNGWIEALLYLFYILPGVIYSVWRRSGQPNACPTCGHAALIPASAREPSPDTHVRCPDCAELVRREARKCKHCGSPLVPQ